MGNGVLTGVSTISGHSPSLFLDEIGEMKRRSEGRQFFRGALARAGAHPLN
jgi:hypothetical protein